MKSTAKIHYNKNNNYSVKPTVDTTDYLITLIRNKLIGYELYFTFIKEEKTKGNNVHTSSVQFINSEYVLLKNILKSLLNENTKDNNDEL